MSAILETSPVGTVIVSDDGRTYRREEPANPALTPGWARIDPSTGLRVGGPYSPYTMGSRGLVFTQA